MVNVHWYGSLFGQSIAHIHIFAFARGQMTLLHQYEVTHGPIVIDTRIHPPTTVFTVISPIKLG